MDHPALQVAMLIVSLLFLCLGLHLRREANKVLHGGTPKDPITFKALSRYPAADCGKHWKNKDDPERVRVLGLLLIVFGVGGIIQTLWRFAAK